MGTDSHEVRLLFAALPLVRKRHVLQRAGLGEYVSAAGLVKTENLLTECDRRPELYRKLSEEIVRIRGGR